MNKNSSQMKDAVNNLREYAKAHGLKLVFRNVTTNAGDFCFFIYKPGFEGYHTRYLIGYDGYWGEPITSNTSFEKCWDDAHKFISNYKI